MSVSGENAVADGSGEMFDRIARRYDRMNRLLSMGMDRSWRRKLIDALGEVGEGEVLDVATGTADIALAIARRYTRARVVGLDPSAGMLEVGRKKVSEAGLQERVALVEGDAQAMSFDDDRFAASCIAFGIRNVPDRLQGLREMARVTKPGGRVVVLELGEPSGGPCAAVARFHVHHVVPRLGAWLSGEREYRYLQQSIADFPSAEDFAETMVEAGLTRCHTERFIFGAAHLYVATSTPV
jgi:demethylmenaquinone methyltransferase/2-methoxy-6-polyprenyl-1,4-benzoquinol methylase